MKITCGFCNKEYMVDPGHLPFTCFRCQTLVDLPDREGEPTLDHSLLLPGQGESLEIRQSRNPLERYRVEHRLAAGGMGEVLLVRDTHLERRVAMKVLRKEMLNHALGRRFVAEAKITARLEHPNIVPIYDMGDYEQGSFFFTMKHIQGKTLSEAIRQWQTKEEAHESLTRRIQIFQKICQAVAYAHGEGVLHRDLKPDNVMLGKFGEVLLVDWGIARQRNFAPGLDVKSKTGAGTQFGQMVGTPGYMSPEQAAGNLKQIDERSDIYGLGALLYELVYLKPAFTAGNLHALVLKASTELPVCPARDPWGNRISLKLKAIILKAMALKREDRYLNVETLEEEIERFLEGRPVLAKKESFWEKMTCLARINMVNSMDIGDIILLLLAFLILGFLVVHAMRTQQRHRQYKKLAGQAHVQFKLGKECCDQKQEVSDLSERNRLQREEDRRWDLASWCAGEALKLKNDPAMSMILQEIEDLRKNSSRDK